MIAAFFYCVCAFLVLTIAWKYATGPAPLDYHARILDKAGVSVPRAVSGLLLAQYRTLAATILAFALAVIAIAIFGVTAGRVWARIAAPVCILVFSLPLAQIGRKAERVTGVRTPWRLGAVTSGIAILAFLLSWLE
ncbi:hypothetical protein [Paracoccus marinaquae]|uniref:Uncharacterized protein n=1 Tax=Paracoccus marinaquae TaxID=2841926 RepID=A0ABS6ADJ1_9RHOB|nr:hypothetical protein [Paracoccus marinaquae]MBU3028667.1 hypothetical protein [Paracoccus marinaquae]